MPIQVRAADGHVIQFPDGTPPSVIQRAMAQDHATRAGPILQGRSAERNGLGPAHGASLTVQQAIPGFPEVGAGLGAATGAIHNMINGKPADFGGEWTKVRNWQQGVQGQFQQDHPAASGLLRGAGYAAQIAPALVSGGATEVPAAVAALAARRGMGQVLKNVAPRVVKNALIGTAYSTVNAFSQPGTLQQRSANAASAVPMGAVIGGGLPEALGVLSKVPGAIANASKVRPTVLTPTTEYVVPAEDPAEAEDSVDEPAPPIAPPLLRLVRAVSPGGGVGPRANGAARPVAGPGSGSGPPTLSLVGGTDAPIGGSAKATVPASGATSAEVADPEANDPETTDHEGSALPRMAPSSANASEIIGGDAHGNAVDALLREGVPLTMGQQIGGLALHAEDAAANMPIVGNTIRVARLRAQEALNRVWANRSLSPIGKTLPADTDVGQDAATYVAGELSNARKIAIRLIQTPGVDGDYFSTSNNILARAQTELSKSMWDVLQRNISKTTEVINNSVWRQGDITNLFENLDAHSDIEPDGIDRSDLRLNAYFSEFRRAVSDQLGRNNPAYKEAIRGVDLGQADLDVWKSAATRSQPGSSGFSARDLKSNQLAWGTSPFGGPSNTINPAATKLVDQASLVMPSTTPDSAGLPKLVHSSAGIANAFAAADPAAGGIPMQTVNAMNPASSVSPVSIAFGRSAAALKGASQSGPPP